MLYNNSNINTRLSPRDITRKYAAKLCSEACTEWKCNTIGDDNFLHKSNQQTKFLKPIRCLPLSPAAE
jgi:hypothetical protein